jgi:hypothetical protein
VDWDGGRTGVLGGGGYTSKIFYSVCSVPMFSLKYICTNVQECIRCMWTILEGSVKLKRISEKRRNHGFVLTLVLVLVINIMETLLP